MGMVNRSMYRIIYNGMRYRAQMKWLWWWFWVGEREFPTVADCENYIQARIAALNYPYHKWHVVT